MASTPPVLVALLLSMCGLDMFGYSRVRYTLNDNFIKVGLCFLLFKVNLYQRNFKCLSCVPLYIYEVSIAFGGLMLNMKVSKVCLINFNFS